MKKFIVIALTFVLTATLFAGCRRNPDTTGSTAAPTTTAAPATKPSTTRPAATTRPEGTGVLPDATDILPDMTDGTGGAGGTGMGRGHRGPRY